MFAIADNDDKEAPNEKVLLKAVLEPRKQWHEVEVYEGAMHGWCPPDGRAYNEAAAEKAWARMLELTDLRNKGSHASGQRLDRQHSLDMADFAVDWHEQFIPYF